MGTTPNYAIPYPELTDPPDGAGQMKLLAQQVDTQLKAVDTALRHLAICQVEQSVSQSIPNNLATVINFDAETVDSTNMHSTASNTSRLTATVAGWYRFSGAISLLASTVGRRIGFWYLNGAVLNRAGGSVPALDTGAAVVVLTSTLIRLNVGEYVEVGVYQSSGAALGTSVAAGYRSSLSADLISD